MLEETTNQIKVYLCIICKTNTISEKRVCHWFEPSGDPHLDGDIFGFDPNTYTNYEIEGGRLFAKKPNQHWVSDATIRLSDTIIRIKELQKKLEKEAPIGGICTQCLENPIVISLAEHIQFQNKSR